MWDNVALTLRRAFAWLDYLIPETIGSREFYGLSTNATDDFVKVTLDSKTALGRFDVILICCSAFFLPEVHVAHSSRHVFLTRTFVGDRSSRRPWR